MGGDCLNYGCAPSKALLAAANTPEARKRSKTIEVLRCRSDGSDRAQTEWQTRGLMKVVPTKGQGLSYDRMAAS